MSRAERTGGGRWRTAAWLVIGAALPAGSAAALVSVRGTVPNTDIALLITGAVLVVATSGRRSAAAVAALSAAVSFDYFHTLPYHSLTIANRNDALATLVLGLLALAVGEIAVRASDSHVELVLVAGAAVLSQAVPQPARFLVDHRGLDVSLAVLVFTTALAIPPRTFRGLTANAGRLVAAVVSGAVVLPALAWVASRIVRTLALRRGVLTVGLAPAEIASVATTSLAGGDTAVAAGMLVASTLIAVAAAGVGLRLLGGGGTIHLVPLLGNLGLVVGAPLAAGIAIRAALNLSERQEAAAEHLSVAVVTLLVWLVASQVHLDRSYLAVAAALAVFLAGSAVLGTALGLRAPAPVAKALLLTTSMRDFAIAAGIAVAAFGAASAAPLGLYGVMAIGWGMAIATLRPTRPATAPDGHNLVPPTISPVPQRLSPAPAPLVATTTRPPAAEPPAAEPPAAEPPAAEPPAVGVPTATPTTTAPTTTTAEADISAIVALLQPGDPDITGFVARAAVDALVVTTPPHPPAPPPVTLGILRDSPAGLFAHVVEHADGLSLRALHRALAAPNKAHSALDSVPIWLSNGSSRGVSTAIAIPHATVLSVGAVRREARIIQTAHAEAIVARFVITLTLSHPKPDLDATDFLLRIVNTIQTRDWSTEL